MIKKTLIIIVGFMFLISVSNLNAISPKSAFNIVKGLAVKFGLKTAQVGKYAIKITNLSKKYGDDLVKIAFKKSGPKAIVVAEKYGADGLKVVSKYGDDAVRLIGKTGGKETISLISKYGDDAIKVMTKTPGSGKYAISNLGKGVSKLSSKEIVRATAYHKEAVINGFGSQFKNNFKKYGNKFISFVMKHKGKFALAGIYGIVKLNPDGELVPGLANDKAGKTVSSFLDYSLYGISTFILILMLMHLWYKRKIYDYKFGEIKRIDNKKEIK